MLIKNETIFFYLKAMAYAGRLVIGVVVVGKKRNKHGVIQKSDEKTNRYLLNSSHIRKGFAICSTAIVLASVTPSMSRFSLDEHIAVASTASTKVGQHPFLGAIIPSAASIAHENDLYASVMMAQAILESGWGTSRLSSSPNHNLFGIKGDYQGNSVNLQTLEDSGGQSYYSIKANFRQYPSYKESLEDYAAVLRNGTSWDPLYYSGTWKSNTTSYTDATSHLTGRYATDTAYNKKLNGIIEKNNLTTYDTPAATPNEHTQAASLEANIPAPTVSVQKAVAPASTGHSYTVQNGDTLWGISAQHGMSLEELKANNRLASDTIYPGQKLVVATKQTASQPASNPIAQVPASANTASTRSYTVQNGDTLWSISQKQGTTVSKLQEWNRLSTAAIYPGQVLHLAAVPDRKAAPSHPAAAPKRHAITVVAGDTLYSLANKTGVSLQQLKAANGLQSTVIHIGQTLYIPGATSPVAAETPAPVKTTTVVARQATSAGSYQVQNGDTLYSIANRVGVTVAELKALNGLQSDTISIGQNLQLQTGMSATVSSISVSYHVQAGDTAYSIARKHGITVEKLLAVNGLTSSTIYPGQILVC